MNQCLKGMMDKMKKIAIVMTVRNRKNKTKNAIESIINANKLKFELYFYITDDGSTDGTYKILEEVKKKYKNYKFVITKADGNQYWCGGMRISYGKALQNNDIDYYLWVNDDVKFFDDFLDTLMKDYDLLSSKFDKFLITGAVKDKITGKVTYGARNVDLKKISSYFKSFIEPNLEVQSCNLVNGNCVLISKKVAKFIGNIDERFIHSVGDYMYGLKLIELGGGCFLSSKYVGYCSRNSEKNTWKDESLSPIKRIKLKHNIKYLPPHLHLIYLKKLCGRSWLTYLFFIGQYVMIFVTSFKYQINKFFKKFINYVTVTLL